MDGARLQNRANLVRMMLHAGSCGRQPASGAPAGQLLAPSTPGALGSLGGIFALLSAMISPPVVVVGVRPDAGLRWVLVGVGAGVNLCGNTAVSVNSAACQLYQGHQQCYVTRRQLLQHRLDGVTTRNSSREQQGLGSRPPRNAAARVFTPAPRVARTAHVPCNAR